MSVAGLLISLLVLLFGIAWIVIPFFEPNIKKSSAVTSAQLERAELSRQYTQTLSTIRELDEDLSTGKIQPEDHEHERHLWAQHGVQILKAIDQLEQNHPSLRAAANCGGDDQSIDAAIEAAVAHYRGESNKQP